MKARAMVAWSIPVAAFLAIAFLAGCNSILHGKKRIDRTNYNRSTCERWLGEAERRTGLMYKGEGINVIAYPGTHRLTGGAWGNAAGYGAYCQGGGDRQYITLYTDPATGLEGDEEGIHEMAHAVLWSHGITGHPAQYAALFALWRD